MFADEIADFYETAQRINADQDPHTVFECIESMIVNPLPKKLIMIWVGTVAWNNVMALGTATEKNTWNDLRNNFKTGYVIVMTRHFDRENLNLDKMIII